MKLLWKALRHAEDGPAAEYLSLTYINLSAIYSELKKYFTNLTFRHQSSLEYANNGIQILTKELKDLQDKQNLEKEAISHPDYLANYSPPKPIEEEDSEGQKLTSLKREKTSLLAIAYYNAGSQLEFLK